MLYEKIRNFEHLVSRIQKHEVNSSAIYLQDGGLFSKLKFHIKKLIYHKFIYFNIFQVLNSAAKGWVLGVTVLARLLS